MSKNFDFIVIGGGIAGLSAAYELSETGSVVVLEAESSAGYHSTGRSAAISSENYGPSRWKRLVTASKGFLENPPAELTSAPLVHPRGALYLSLPHEEAQLRQEAADLQSRGAQVDIIPMDDVLQLCSVIKAESFSLGLHEPDCRDIDTNELMQVYQRGLKRRGGMFVSDARVGELRKHSRQWTVVTQSETYHAPLVVNAAGAWARDVAVLAGLPERKVVPFRRTAVTFDPPADIDISGWPMIFDAAETFYFKPEAGKVMVSPVDMAPSEPCDAQADEFEVAIAIDRIQRHTFLDVPNLSHKWGGLRTFASDHEPVIGCDPADETFVWLAGQGGNGVMGGPAAARLAAALALGNGVPADIAALGITAADVSPGRDEVARDVIVGSIDIEA